MASETQPKATPLSWLPSAADPALADDRLIERRAAAFELLVVTWTQIEKAPTLLSELGRLKNPKTGQTLQDAVKSVVNTVAPAGPVDDWRLMENREQVLRLLLDTWVLAMKMNHAETLGSVKDGQGRSLADAVDALFTYVGGKGATS